MTHTDYDALLTDLLELARASENVEEMSDDELHERRRLAVQIGNTIDALQGRIKAALDAKTDSQDAAARQV